VFPQRSPFTEYCVEHAMAPQTDPTPGGDGYSQYVSCNSDECEVTNNSTPRAPVCICWVHDDRENSQQPESDISKVCNARDDPTGAGNNHFGANFILKVIILPRQARDKHRESSQNK
jgi:hypothetical protein